MVRTVSGDPYRDIWDDETSWWVPTHLPDQLADRAPGEIPQRLSAAQLELFKTQGFLVVDNLWPESLVHAARDEIEQLLPPGSDAMTPAIPGSDGLVSIPVTAKSEASPEMALNALPVCPTALGVISQLLQIPATDIRLSQCHVSIKHGRCKPSEQGDSRSVVLSGDQDMHLDFHDNMLLVPSRSPLPAIAALCYYSQVEDCAGATHLSPTQTSAADEMVSARSRSSPSSIAGLRCEDVPPPGPARNAWTLQNVASFKPRWHHVHGPCRDVWVAHDYFAVDGVRIPCDATTAARVAAYHGGRLPTPEEVDAIWRAADIQLPPLPWGPPYGEAMNSSSRILVHSSRIDEQLPADVDDKLLAGHKKDVVPSTADPSRVSIYGWHYTNGQRIQPLNSICSTNCVLCMIVA